MTWARLLFYFFLSFIFGIIIHSLAPRPWLFLWPLVLALFVGVGVAFFKTKWWWLSLFCLLGFSLGLYRVEMAARSLEKIFVDTPIVMRVASEISRGPKSTQFLAKTATGRVWTIAPDQIIFHYGDIFRAECQYKKVTPDEKYSSWYFSQGAGSICFLKSARLVARGVSVMRFFGELKERVTTVIDKTFRLTSSALLSGMLFGGSFREVKDLNNDFRAAGLSHLVAISGYNFSLLAFFIASLFELFYLPRRLVTIFSITLLGGFFILVGPSASAARAVVMATFVLLAKVFGRRRSTTEALVLTAAILLLINPLSLRYDAGFDLSFAATITLLYLAPWLMEKLHAWLRLADLKGKWLLWKKEKIVNAFFSNVLASTSIMITTAPILWYFFGRISLVSVLSNVLVAPVVPVIMISGYLLVILSLIYYPLGSLLAWFLEPLLRYVIAIANFLS